MNMGDIEDENLRKEIEKKVQEFEKDESFDDGPLTDFSLLGKFSEKEFQEMKKKLKISSSAADDEVSNAMVKRRGHPKGHTPQIL